MPLPTSYLFAPGHRADRFDKARDSGAGMVVLDLEDAVDPRDKATSRAAIAAWIAGAALPSCGVMVRINDAASRFFAEDLLFLRGLCAAHGPMQVMVPKVESETQVGAVAAALVPGSLIVPMIESARGLRAVDAIAGAPMVQRLAFGTWDFGVDLNLSGDERGLMVPSMMIALASRCAGIAPPIAGVTTSIHNQTAIAHDSAFARAFGFTAKLCIHPAQIGPVHASFAPSEAERQWAARVVAAAHDGAALKVDGAMVDRPVLLRAQAILDYGQGR